MKPRFLEYRSAIVYNSHAFSIEHSDLLKVFFSIDGNFDVLLQMLSTLRDDGRKSHVSEIPWVFLLQRQAYNAFEAVCVGQCHQTWLLIRPGIEGALIIGKWVDDVHNARIWEHREEDPESYRKAYSGKGLRSKSLPDAERIQTVLKTINDRFVHANISYYQRHLQVETAD